MNAVGKILVMLNLVMSLVFMSFAILVYSTHRNWEEYVVGPAPNMPQGLKGEIEKVRDENLTATNEIAALKAENAREIKSRDDRLAMLESKSTSLQQQLTAKQAEVDSVIKDKAVTAAQTAASLEQLGIKEDENQQLKETIASTKVQVEEMHRKILELTGNVGGLATNLANAREQNAILVAELQKLKAMAAGRTSTKNDPVLEGIVSNVLNSASESLVEISLGSDDGVSRGMTFEVIRGDKYLGRIEIMQATADAAVGRSVPEFRKGNIEKNDHVTTKLVR
jgi:hypothetical protein